MHILALANQKGGVGKTFLAFHLAHFLVESGRKVLMIDFDPQGNLSLCFRKSFENDIPCRVTEVFELERLNPETIKEGLWLVPADIRLARFEASSGGVGIYFKLKKAIEAYLKNNPVDVVLIDCPPSLGLFSLSAFVAAQKIIVPLRSEVFSISGLGDLLNVVSEVKENINPNLEVQGLVLNAYQGRTRIGRDTLSELKEIGLPLLAIIPQSIRAEEALRAGLPVWHLAPEAPISKALEEGLSCILRTL